MKTKSQFLAYGVIIALFITGPALAAEKTAKFLGVLDFGCGLEQSDQKSCDAVRSIHAEPRDQSPVIGSFSGKSLQGSSPQPSDKIQTIEFDYEINGPVIGAVNMGWYKIRFENKAGWVKKARDYKFLAYPDMVKNTLAYVNIHNVPLYPIPDLSSAPLEILKPLIKNNKNVEKISVEVLETNVDKSGHSWIRVNIPTVSHCMSGTQAKTGKSGWIPAYVKNESTVWYYARGC